MVRLWHDKLMAAGLMKMHNDSYNLGMKSGPTSRWPVDGAVSLENIAAIVTLCQY